MWGPTTLLLATAIVWLFRPQPVLVDLAAVQRGPMRVTVREEGQTRIRDIFVLSAPVGGLVRRIGHEVGDRVRANDTIVARIEPSEPDFLDVRTEAQARAAIQAAQAARELARAELNRADAELEFARAELNRARDLSLRGLVSNSALDEAQRRARTASAAHLEAQAQLDMRDFQVEQARAQLVAPTEARSRSDCECVNVYSPVDGQILRLIHESESVQPAGAALIEIGDPTDLEIVVDLLSSDAVKVEAGQRVVIEEWGGDSALEGTVNRVEPYGFTKVSALGIEEQRVNVIVDLSDPSEKWARLGHGYRVEASIVIWEADAVLKAPMSALFRQGRRWAAYAVEDNRARVRTVEVGRRNGLVAEIVSGLEPTATVVLNPGDRVSEGVEVTSR